MLSSNFRRILQFLSYNRCSSNPQKFPFYPVSIRRKQVSDLLMKSITSFICTFATIKEIIQLESTARIIKNVDFLSHLRAEQVRYLHGSFVEPSFISLVLYPTFNTHSRCITCFCLYPFLHICACVDTFVLRSSTYSISYVISFEKLQLV